MASKHWIAGAVGDHRGALRAALGIKAGKNIPEAKLEKAAKKGGKLGKEARLAETLKKMHKGK